MPITWQDKAPDWLRDAHAGRSWTPPHGRSFVGPNLDGNLDAWRRWPRSMDFLDPRSDNHAWMQLRAALYADIAAPCLPGGEPSGLRVLDVACGPGRFLLPWAAAGHAVDGVDLVRPSLDAARRHLEAGSEGPVTLTWADLEHPASLDHLTASSWDRVLAIETLCYLDDPAALLRRLRGRSHAETVLIASVEAWPGALLSRGLGGADPTEVLRTRRLHGARDFAVQFYDRAGFEALLVAGGWRVERCAGTHWLVDGPLGSDLEIDRVGQAAYHRQLRHQEQILRGDATLAELPRAWVAIATPA